MYKKEVRDVICLRNISDISGVISFIVRERNGKDVNKTKNICNRNIV